MYDPDIEIILSDLNKVYNFIFNFAVCHIYHYCFIVASGNL